VNPQPPHTKTQARFCPPHKKGGNQHFWENHHNRRKKVEKSKCHFVVRTQNPQQRKPPNPTGGLLKMRPLENGPPFFFFWGKKPDFEKTPLGPLRVTHGENCTWKNQPPVKPWTSSRKPPWMQKNNLLGFFCCPTTKTPTPTTPFPTHRFWVGFFQVHPPNPPPSHNVPSKLTRRAPLGGPATAYHKKPTSVRTGPPKKPQCCPTKKSR